MKYVLPLLAVIIIGIPPRLWALSKCPQAMAMHAEREVSSIQNWTKLHKAYIKFAVCDDGAIAEGFSDSVIRLLYDHWNETNNLNDIVITDKRFGDFVIHHVNELMSPVQASTIKHHAMNDCPVAAKELCEKIILKITDLTKAM